MSNLSRYRAQENDEMSNPSDLQWLEDGINFMGAWMKDTLFPTKRESDIIITDDLECEPDKITKRKQKRGRKIIRIREREIEITIED